jgi:hypothetical protein
MDDVNKMFRTIVNGQSAMKQELLVKIEGVDKKVTVLSKETKEGFKKVNKRLDMIGKFVVFLEDDSPTREEHDKLEKRVSKVERKLQIQAST